MVSHVDRKQLKDALVQRMQSSIIIVTKEKETIWELGLTVPDQKLRKRDDGVWEYTEPDWAELRHAVTGHGPKTADRLDLRRAAREQSAWVRSVVLAEAA